MTIKCLFLVIVASSVAAQSGGQYTITESVIASGGANSGGGEFSATGTVGQSVAGTRSTGGQYGASAGFWQAALAPSAAGVIVGGRLTTADGRGIFNVSIVLRDAASGQIMHSRSSAFGYYRFEDVPAGQTYLLTVLSKRYTFANPTRVISVNDEITDADFVADQLQ